MQIKLGQKVKCKISGFTGLATAHSKHLFGCDRFWVQPPVDKDGKFVDGCWMDELSLEVIEEKVHIPETFSKTGGPPSKVK